MKNNQQWLYLLSSNATKEYMLDILETLALPKNTVQHFRYELKKLGQDLKDMLPLENDLQNKSYNNDLKDKKVLISYLYQTKEEEINWLWKAIYPVRFGTLMDAYKTGPEEWDIAHFYFKVEEHLHFNVEDVEKFFESMREKSKQSSKNAYAFVGKPFNNDLLSVAKDKDDKSAFYETCNNFNLDHFKGPTPKSDKYFPLLFCYIKGIKEEDGEILSPGYNHLYYRSFYTFVEGKTYSFDFATYSKKEPLEEYSVKLLSDKKLFSNPYEYKRKFDCRYNEESFALIPSLQKNNVSSELTFNLGLARNSEKPEDENQLSMNIIFDINIIRNKLDIIWKTASDISFGLGTALIALKAVSRTSSKTPSLVKSISSWWAILILFVVWLICKSIINLRRE